MEHLGQLSFGVIFYLFLFRRSLFERECQDIGFGASSDLYVYMLLYLVDCFL